MQDSSEREHRRGQPHEECVVGRLALVVAQTVRSRIRSRMASVFAAHMKCMTKTLQHKNQVGQPSDNGGHFAAKTFDDAAEVDLTGNTEMATRAEILSAVAVACEEAGYAGAMPGVYELLLDRHDSEDPMAGALNELNARAVDDAYDNYVGDAVDATAKRIRGLTSPLAGAGSLVQVMNHVHEMSEVAGLGGVMPGIIEAALERDQEDIEFLDRAYGLTPADITNIYENVVGPEIDDLEQDILENHCSECGASTDDGEGYDGKCGNCADIADSCQSCGGYVEDEGKSVCDDCAESNNEGN